MAKKKEESNPIEEATKSGSDMIREMLEKGIEKPKDIIAAVKQEYDVDVKPGLVSIVKSKWKEAKGDTKQTRGRRKAASAPTANGASSDFIGQLRQLVGIIGKDGVKSLIDGL